MLYGELGLLPLKTTIQKRMLTYWGKLVTSDEDRLSRKLYEIMLNENRKSPGKFAWLQYIEKLLNESGYGDIWIFQHHRSSL